MRAVTDLVRMNFYRPLVELIGRFLKLSNKFKSYRKNRYNCLRNVQDFKKFGLNIINIQ